jgi:predicted glycosyltransferase
MNLRLWSAVAVIILGYVVGFYFQHREMDALKDSLNRRIDDLRSEMNACLEAVNRHFDDLLRYLDQRFRNLEERLERLERVAK